MNAAIEKLAQRTAKRPISLLAGFDGFVDTLVRPMRESGAGAAQYFETIAEFGEYLAKRSGKSCSIVLQTQQRGLGGNAPILANAAQRLGQSVVCIGALGGERLDPAFAPLAEGCAEVMTAAEPGLTTALEFDDGKIMLMQNDDIDRLDYERLEQRIGRDKLNAAVAQADITALLNWSEPERGTELWRGLLDNCISGLDYGRGKKLLVDLCDCSRKNKEQLDEVTGLLCGFSQHMRTLLSLNRNESETLARHFLLEPLPPEQLATALRRALGVEAVVIHNVAYACAAWEQGTAIVPTVPIKKPVRSTGAGDHFNSGLAVAWGHGLSFEEALYIANAVARRFVVTGQSPTLAQLAEEA